MSLWLNKIEMDLSRKLQEETSDTRVHRKKLRKADNNVKKPYVEDTVDNKINGDKKKKFITIDGEIIEVKKMEVEAEFPEVTEGQPSRGIFLDAKK